MDFRPSSSNFEKIWKEKYNDPVPILQPQIDLVIKNETENTLDAIEIKFFKRKNTGSGFKYPYYFGLGQAIAYLRLGFNHVALWHVFDNIPRSQFAEYGTRVWDFIYELLIPVHFTICIFNEKDGSIRPKRNNDPKDKTLADDLSKLGSGMGWRDKINPNFVNHYLERSEITKKIRAVIDETNPIKSMT